MKLLTQPTELPLIPQTISLQQSIPRLEPVFLLWWFGVWVVAAPCFCRSLAIEILVRSDMVVPVAECAEVYVELRDVRHLPLIQLLFERAIRVRPYI